VRKAPTRAARPGIVYPLIEESRRSILKQDGTADTLAQDVFPETASRSARR
jgi:hypothetical protein